MSLDKAIESGKEHRKQYRGAESVDRSCRCHGGDEWELSNRMHGVRKRELGIKEQIEEYEREER